MLPRRSTFLFAALVSLLAAASPTAAASCNGDSCKIADLARTTGNAPPTSKPAGWIRIGESCILGVLAQLQGEGRLPANACPGQVYGPCSAPSKKRGKLRGREADWEDASPEASLLLAERQSSGGGCTPYTLLYAKGTAEQGGALGTSLGPKLHDDLTGDGSGLWTVTGVDYNNTIDNLECMGMPGGLTALALLESIASSCPSSKIIVSGYSQGAMVAHAAVAWARPAARARVVGVATFGDPFDGADIAGFGAGARHTECDALDTVCLGTGLVGPFHYVYGGDPLTRTEAWMRSVVGQTA